MQSSFVMDRKRRYFSKHLHYGLFISLNKITLVEIENHLFNCSTEQECIPVGCIPSAAVAICWGGCLPRGLSARGGVCPGGGGVCPGGICPGRGCLSRGVSPVGVCPGGVYPSMHWGRHPPVDRMTDRCKNITFPQVHLCTVMTTLQLSVFISLCG